MTTKTRKSVRNTKPAVRKPVAYNLGNKAHKGASAAKRGVLAAGRSIGAFFRAVKEGWKAA